MTSEICECGKSEHDPKCVGSIENGVMGLLSLLRKYKIGDVPPLDQDKSEKIKEGIREKKESEERPKELEGCQGQPFEGVGYHPLRPYNSLLTLGPYLSHFR